MDVPFVRFVLNRPAIARHGLRPGDVAEAIETSLAGATVGRVFERGAAVRPDREARSAERRDFERIGDLPIDTPAGASVPIRLLADVRRERGPEHGAARERPAAHRGVEQRRRPRSGQRRGRHPGRRVVEAVPLPAGYRVEYGGQFESEQSASQRLLWSGAVVVAALFMLLVLAFGRARDALIVMLNLPLALIGGVAGVFLAGGVLNVATIIGFITLFGIATRNGIMLVSHIRHLRESEGVTDLREAVERGGARAAGPDSDDRDGRRPGADSARARRRTVGQRDSDADGDRHPVRPGDVDAAQHVRGADDVPAVGQVGEDEVRGADLRRRRDGAECNTSRRSAGGAGRCAGLPEARLALTT